MIKFKRKPENTYILSGSCHLSFQFRAVMDSLHQTFDQCVATNNFAEISGSVISWVEEHCKPQVCKCGTLSQVKQISQYE